MHRTSLYIVATLLAVASPAAAQSVNGTAIGLGVALNPVALVESDEMAGMLPLGFGNFTVPIRVGSRLRLEPEFGILRFHADFSGSGVTNTVLRYGLAAHFFLGGTEDFQPYVGPRIGFARESESYESYGGPIDESRTHNYVGVAIGGEYWLTSRFSVGGEVQINRVGIGQESGTDTSMSYVSNNGVVAVRFYL